MLVLGLETTTPICSAALWQNGHLIAEQRYKVKNLHAEIISDMIRQMVLLPKLDIDQIKGVAVSKGPGSFTGLRIGMAIGKAIAFAKNLPIVGIHTLDAIASGVSPVYNRIIVVLPSRKGEIYAAPYRVLDGFFHREGKIIALRVSDFSGWAGNIDCVVGPGISSLKSAGISDRFYLPEIFWQISAVPVARLGARRLLAGEKDDLASLEPDYIKPFYTTAKAKMSLEAV